MTRRLLLVAMDHIREKDPAIPLGLASIMGVLDAAGFRHRYETKVFNVAGLHDKSDSHIKQDSAEMAQQLIATNASDIVLGAFVWNEPYIQHIHREIKRQAPHIRIGLAGPQVTYAESNQKLQEHYYPSADYFIRGYAENAVLQLIQNHPLDSIQGISSSSNSTGHSLNSTNASFDASVLHADTSPFTGGILPAQPFMRYESQRGCAFQCSFCQHRDTYGKGVTRFDSGRIDSDITWIKQQAEAGVLRDLAVVDPLFNSSSLHASSMLHALQDTQLRDVSLQLRPERLHKSLVQQLREAQSDVHFTLEFGIQSMEERELEVIDRVKGTSAAKVTNKVKSKLEEVKGLKRDNPACIDYEISLIYGLPFQTVDSFKRSLDWCKTEHPDARVLAFPLMLLRGTSLHVQKEALGLEEACLPPYGNDKQQDDKRIHAFIPHVVKSPTMSTRDWYEMGEFASTASAVQPKVQ